MAGSPDIRDPQHRVPVSVVGAHGGAGTSTVACLLGATDAGQHWPAPGESGFPPDVLVIARTSAAGLTAATRELAAHRATSYPQGPHLVGFVLVPDAPGRLPKSLSRRIAILSSATMVFRLPWVREWRLSETAAVPCADWPVMTRLRDFVEQAMLTATPAAN